MAGIKVTITGLPVEEPYVPKHLHEKVNLGLQATEKKFKEAGIEQTFLYAKPDDVAGSIGPELAKSKPDCVVIGFGARGDPKLTPYFEDLVNTAHITLPGCKFAFNSEPGNSLEAVQRVMNIS
ncbi:hypothetical protein WJX73_001615 [Symbiochloris irregularis]|uniref:Uncharacterized protein n=1 Tax=Symbiochloris irregularis TaxID=706552 RepID=A0AAW1NST6_9CHLO